MALGRRANLPDRGGGLRARSTMNAKVIRYSPLRAAQIAKRRAQIMFRKGCVMRMSVDQQKAAAAQGHLGSTNG
jgi:hypothetical protein